MSSKRKRRGNLQGGKASRVRTNYYLPLQTLNDQDVMDEDNAPPEEVAKVSTNKVPPITVIKSTTDQLLKLLESAKVDKYSIRKISIGHKIFCSDANEFDVVSNALKASNIEFFSFTPKNNRPFKAVLSGLDLMNANIVKSELSKLGLQVLDVKLIHRMAENNREIVLYVVYLAKGSISMRELREKFNAINRIRVKWEYHARRRNKLTQCHNCQMFGHGALNCNVRAFCSICAGSHSTTGCKATNTKCINCGGQHKSTDADCPSRLRYSVMRERHSKISPHYNRMTNSTGRYQTRMTASTPFIQPYSNTNTLQNSWANTVRNGDRDCQQNNNTNDLFSSAELQSLTFELIKNLKKCNSKLDQFNVITNLAFKFLP